MIRSRQIVFSAVLGALVPVLLIWLAREFAPSDMNDDVARAMMTAITRPVLEFEDSSQKTIYIRADVFEQELISLLQRKYPQIAFHPWSERPEDQGCVPKEVGTMVVGACQRPDFISVRFLSQPLWHMAIIGVGTYNEGGESILVRTGSAWRIVSEQWSVT